MSEDEKASAPSNVPVKSSMEILSELFSSFDATPPVIVKKEKGESKKHKKSKKKHKHKDKKHKKKDKKPKRRRSCSRSSENSEYDLAKILIKNERESPEKRLNLEGIDFDTAKVKAEVKAEPKDERAKSPIAKESIDDKKKGASSTKSEQKKENSSGNKIVIKNLKFSSVFEATIEELKRKEREIGELSDSDNEHKSKSDRSRKKRKSHHHKSEEKHKHSKSSRDRSRSRSKKRDRDESVDRKSKHHRSRSRDRDYCNRESKHDDYSFRTRDDYKYKEDKLKYQEYDDYRDRESDYKSKRARTSFYDEDSSKSKDDKDEKWFLRDKYRSYSSRDRERDDRRKKSESDDSYIDKKKLLEIARKNAIQMMKSGSLPGALTLGPQAQEKVIAAIKAGGKTIEELTDFCKTLSKKEEVGELSSISGDDASDSDNERAFHHPFQIKDRPTSITMNIKNSVPLPIKSTHERTSELRMQFPVSSGQLHRKTENEWVPVSPKKSDSAPKAVQTAAFKSADGAPLAIEAPPKVPEIVVSAPVTALPGPQIIPKSTVDSTIDIGSIVSQRLSAIRKLQENPNDVQAITEMYRAQKEMQSWAESKQKPGQFTGSTGAQILSQAELSSGYQAWAKKNQLQTAAPVSGGMGMHLLQKMGWRPGEGLGKEKSGALEPLLLEVKLDKKGLVANEEQKKKQMKQPKVATKTLEGKHPVSLLGEFASKRKLGAPQYDLCFECGPDHKKNFLFKVILNGIEYKPNVASPNKKEAKANAAKLCLQQLGLLIP